jgi:hypothetical protein
MPRRKSIQERPMAKRRPLRRPERAILSSITTYGNEKHRVTFPVTATDIGTAWSKMAHHIKSKETLTPAKFLAACNNEFYRVFTFSRFADFKHHVNIHTTDQQRALRRDELSTDLRELYGRANHHLEPLKNYSTYREAMKAVFYAELKARLVEEEKRHTKSGTAYKRSPHIRLIKEALQAVGRQELISNYTYRPTG